MFEIQELFCGLMYRCKVFKIQKYMLFGVIIRRIVEGTIIF